MISSRERGLYQLFVFGQLVAVFCLFWLLFPLVFTVLGKPYPSLWTYCKYLTVGIIAMTFEAISRPPFLKFRAGKIKRIAARVARRQTLWVLLAMMLLMVFSKDVSISRVFLSTFIVTTFLTLWVSNRRPAWVGQIFGDAMIKKLRTRTIVLGPEAWCKTITPELSKTSGLIEIKEEIHTDDSFAETREGSPELRAQIDQAEFDLLVLPPRSIPPEFVIAMMRLGDRKGFRCWLPVEYSRQYGRHFHIERAGQLDILTPPVEPLENTSSRVVKRVFDFVFALVVIVTVLPLACLLVWILHRLFSPGPLFFKQERIGLYGSTFLVFKFRSLNVDHGSEEKQVSKNDDRIFKGGRFIRKTSLDEVPQFLNVLLGEMSVVGPRPHMAEHDDEFRLLYEHYGHRSYVKPGITGLAQAKGFRGEVQQISDLRHRARLDRFYVLNWTFGFDLAIIVRTLVSMIKPPKTAY